jgi:hypothetical protein
MSGPALIAARALSPCSSLPRHARRAGLTNTMAGRVGERRLSGQSIYPDRDTHIETVTNGGRGDSLRFLYTLR